MASFSLSDDSIFDLEEELGDAIAIAETEQAPVGPKFWPKLLGVPDWVSVYLQLALELPTIILFVIVRSRARVKAALCLTQFSNIYNSTFPANSSLTRPQLASP